MHAMPMQAKAAQISSATAFTDRDVAHLANTTVPTVPSWLTMNTAASSYMLQMRSVGSLAMLTLAHLTDTGNPGG